MKFNQGKSSRYCSAIHKIKRYSLVLFATLSCSSVMAVSTLESLIDDFQVGINWIDSNTLHKPYILFPFTNPLHQVNIDLMPISDQISNPPTDARRQATEMFQGHYVLVDDRNTRAYFSPTTDFSGAIPVGVGAKAYPVPQWYVTDFDGSSITLQYGYMHVNAWLVDAYINMYDATGNEMYLDKSREILNSLAQTINVDGRFYRYFNGVDYPAYYNGMNQGIVMRSLHSYVSRRSSDKTMIGMLCHMADGYVHTAEGVWNHWSNSIIGGIIRDEVLGTSDVNYDSIYFFLNHRLYPYISEFNGRIPKEMKREAPKFPTFSATYQTYDVYMISLLGNYLPEDSGFSGDVFDLSFTEAKNKNYAVYYGNNSNTIWQQYKNFGIKNDEYAEAQASKLKEVIVRPYDAYGKVMTAAALANYWHGDPNLSYEPVRCN